MGLLLRHPDGGKRIENGSALNFQLPSEIVDSNLAHPAFLVPVLRLSLHRTLTEPTYCTRTPSMMSACAICVIKRLFGFGSGTSFRLLLFVFAVFAVFGRCYFRLRCLGSHCKLGFRSSFWRGLFT